MQLGCTTGAERPVTNEDKEQGGNEKSCTAVHGNGSGASIL